MRAWYAFLAKNPLCSQLTHYSINKRIFKVEMKDSPKKETSDVPHFFFNEPEISLNK